MDIVEINSRIIGLEKPLLRKVFGEGSCENFLDSCDGFDSKGRVQLHLKEKELTCRWREGDVCLARWSEDGVWYRAKIGCLFNQEVAFTAAVLLAVTRPPSSTWVSASRFGREYK